MKMRILKDNAIKAYKAFEPGWTCRGFQYKVGRTYQHKGSIEICERGFHACETASDCFRYYPFNSREIKFAEVLCWDEIERADDDSKLCCASIQIVREMAWEEVLKVCNYGSYNSGYRNSGNSNSGNCNSGSYNSGSLNSGNCNTGSRNTGHYNSGGWNSGNWNTGNWNSGDWNTGCWNAGDRNSGFFNTLEQKDFFCFNKPTEKHNIWFPNFLYFDVIKWVSVEMMTDKEKNEHPEYKVIGGYLKRYNYQEAFRKSFLAAKEEKDWPDELAKLKAIPNFDYKIFEEISGISKEELEA